MTFRRGWRNRASGTSDTQPLVGLGLRALYDYRAADATGFYDQSGNGQAKVTAGAGAAAPTWLPYTVPQVYFPGTAGNTVSCTAPATAASYSAQPVGGGAPVTGAAASGAFSFGASNAGAFESVSILNGSAVEIARYSASLSTQTGHTDAYAVAWTVNRSSTGFKTVVQSHAGASAAGKFLLGGSHWLDVPLAAMPALDTRAAATGVIAVFRRWHNPGTAGHAILATKANIANIALGISFRMSGTATSTDMNCSVGDGAAVDGGIPAHALALGIRGVMGANVGSSSPFVQMFMNGQAATVDTSRATTTTTTGLAARIGAYTDGSGAIDAEFEALLTRDTPFTAAEVALVTAVYGGGL